MLRASYREWTVAHRFIAIPYGRQMHLIRRRLFVRSEQTERLPRSDIDLERDNTLRRFGLNVGDRVAGSRCDRRTGRLRDVGDQASGRP
jgi:hypothetical protein